MSTAVKVRVLAGKRKPDTYLFIESETEIEDLPPELLLLLGELRDVITLDITREKQLARCSGEKYSRALPMQVIICKCRRGTHAP